jgi:hypothetical protein
LGSKIPASLLEAIPADGEFCPGEVVGVGTASKNSGPSFGWLQPTRINKFKQNINWIKDFTSLGSHKIRKKPTGLDFDWINQRSLRLLTSF